MFFRQLNKISERPEITRIASELQKMTNTVSSNFNKLYNTTA